MEKLCITDKISNGGNLLYLKNTLNELFSQTGCGVSLNGEGGRALLEIEFPEHYSDIICAEVADKLAEVIAVGYKYQYLKKNLKVAGLTENGIEILYSALISGDVSDDKKYAFKSFIGRNQIAIDGVYNFKLRPLKNKWDSIISYIPSVYTEDQLKDFITFLLAEENRKVYVDNGKVYDAHYRRLIRTDLTGEDKVRITREVLLAGCGKICLSGKLPEEDERCLKEYFGDKIIFSTVNLN